ENNVETEQTNNVIEENEDTVSDNDTENWVSTGIHHEKIDSETIEINTEENKETYMLYDSEKKDLEKIKKDTEISYTYKYNKNKNKKYEYKKIKIKKEKNKKKYKL